MTGFFKTTAPWGATFLGFLVGAATATSVVPVVFYNASQDFTALLVVACGVVVAPFAGLVGVSLTNKLP